MDHPDALQKRNIRFVDSLLDEYLSRRQSVFIGDLHIGTDEYNKKEAEQYRYFTDRYLKFVEIRQKCTYVGRTEIASRQDSRKSGRCHGQRVVV
ncbi:MAG: hypothetical protein ACLUDY_10725 [Bacteroides xylanisolvens]